MKHRLLRISIIAVLSLSSMTACVTNQQMGSVLGGVAGGAAASSIGKGTGKTVAIIAGTVLGAAIGGAIGSSMDANDQRQVQDTFETYPDNRSSTWRNPNTNREYEMTPQRTYYENSSPCREYTMTAYIDGRPETVRGTACRQPDGTWKTTN